MDLIGFKSEGEWKECWWNAYVIFTAEIQNRGTPGYRREYSSQYYQKHREKQLERGKRYNREHRDQRKEYEDWRPIRMKVQHRINIALWAEKHKERVLEMQRAWRKRNPEKVMKAVKNWKEKNPEKVKLHMKSYRTNHREAVLAYHREHFSRSKKVDREKHREYARLSYQNNSEKHKATMKQNHIDHKEERNAYHRNYYEQNHEWFMARNRMRKLGINLTKKEWQQMNERGEI